MTSEIETLASMLDETAELLRESGFVGWSEWFAIDAKRIRSLNFFGIEHLLTAFGGMGSFNDVVPGHQWQVQPNHSGDQIGADCFGIL